ncbi:MAG: ABC transporter permease, partial [Rhodothermales bacterium]
MLKSYLKSALRALTKRPGYAFLNIAGLAIGLACFGLILMFVQDELSYDAQHKDADRIYRVAFIGYPPGSAPDRFAVTSPPIGRTLRSDFPEVESVVRINPFTTSVTYRGEKQFDQEFWYAEADLFNVFTLPVVNGPDQDLLVAPNTAVITESTARRIFGNTDPVGKTIAMNDTNMVSIQAVIADFPSNSHFRTDYILSYATLLQRQPEGENWLSMGVYTYLKLRPGVNEPQFATKVAPMINERFAEQMQQMGFDSELVLEPLRSIYLKSNFRAQIGPTGDMTQVWVFSAIAVFVLLLACINFTNLATARSMERAREVGVRKVSGS